MAESTGGKRPKSETITVTLQAGQVAALVAALAGGWSAKQTVETQLEQAQQQLGGLQAQISRLEDRLAAEEAARAQRVSSAAVVDAQAEVARAQLESRLMTLEACHRSPRSCPLR